MWIFGNNTFVSLVQHRDDPDKVIVRARFKGDIEEFFDQACEVVEQTPDADYPFRLVTDHAAAQKAVEEYMRRTLDYPNFKASVPLDQNWRHDLYLQVWCAMRREQERQMRRETDDQPELPWDPDEYPF